ncbi:MAG: bacterioferritin [Chloroflexi bacterium]|nr:bacterioferritin [Chloroflexota bacterium]
MRAKEGVLDLLNQVLTNELTAINQYFVHAEMIKNWGYHRLFERLRAFSIEEMRDAEQLIGHILYLEGLPNLQRLGTVRVGENAEEDLRLDVQQEAEAVETLRQSITHCQQVGDYTTRGILEQMVREQEQHIDWLETQLDTIRQVGGENYLAQQIEG